MATSGYAVDVYSGRPSNDLILEVKLYATSGNSTRWSWTLTARKFSYASWVLDPKPWSVNVEGNTWSGEHNLDFRNTDRIVLGSGVTGWIAHDSNGYNAVTFSASHRDVGVFGTASLSGSFAANRIPKPPTAPGVPVLSAVGPTSLTAKWTAPSNNNGASITGYEIQYATNSGFTSNLVTVSVGASSLSQAFSNLTPSTDYWFRVRAKNSQGWGAWSAASTTRTLSGFYVWNGSAWRPAATYVWNGSAWKVGEVFVWNGTEWRSAS